MDRDTKLKEFAAALFSHVYREYNTTFDLPVKLPHVFSNHPPHDSAGEEAAAVLRLCLALRGVFNGLFVTSFETFQATTEQFMTFLTSRALRLCSADEGDDVFLAFCMVCAFIAELNLFCLINGCFAFISTAPKCLQAIFNRRLRKEFFAQGGWDALKCWSEHFAGNVLPEEVVSEDLLESIKNKLTEVASSSSSEDEEEEEEEEDLDEAEETDEEGEDKDEDAEKSKAKAQLEDLAIPGPSTSQPIISSDEDSEEEEDESEEESDSESEEESEEESKPKTNGQKRLHEEDSEEDSEESEPDVKLNGVKKRIKFSEDDEESDSEEEEESDDTSSMSEEDSEEESEEDSPVKKGKVQTNCIKAVAQDNVTVEKEVL